MDEQRTAVHLNLCLTHGPDSQVAVSTRFAHRLALHCFTKNRSGKLTAPITQAGLAEIKVKKAQ